MDFGIPPHYLIPIVGILAGTTMTAILLYPVVRADESIAIEVERISEGQRFLTKIQSEKLPPTTPDRPR